MSQVIQVPPTKRMEAAWIAALAVGVYLTWRHYERVAQVLDIDPDRVELARQHARIRVYRKAAVWAGERALKAEKKYGEVLDRMR